MEDKVLVPFAPILIESTRSIGYSFEAALADIIDNSIGKGARNVDVFFQSNGNQYVAVVDDACGMDEDELESAMRYGSKSSLEARDENDLGRFGLGLKMASLSQCRKLTVISKKNGEYHAAKWDLDYVLEKGDWMLQKYAKDEIENFILYEELCKNDNGTIVLWEDFDRIALGAANTQRVFDEKIDIARDHISLVFHRFMNEEAMMRRVKICFNGAKVDPIDPFLTGNPATQPMIEQTISVDGSQIKVKPYILPHLCKLTSKDKRQVGGTDDLRQTQGFYVYRNKRLIIWGTWFRLIRQYELNKLARVRVDIPNTLDHIWEIDVKKSSASLPDLIKKNLIGIVENSVGRSERVYRYRGRKVDDSELQHIWNKVDNRGNIQYLINRDMPMFKLLESAMSENGTSYLDQFVKIIEDAFPYAAVYYGSKQQIINLYNGNAENSSYNLLAVMLFLINDYHEYGVYNNKENIIEVNGDGGILWDKTVNESLSFLCKNRPYYTDMYTGKSVDDAFDFFKRIHECILTECTKQLELSDLLDLFEIIPLHLSEEKLDDFGSLDYLLYRIQSELSIQFNSRKQILLKTMYAYVLQHRAFEDCYGISMYGTNSFNLVWEDVCSEVFDNKLHTSLGHLNLPVPLIDVYDKKNTLLDVIQKPIWGGTDQQGFVFSKMATQTLIPDLIALVHRDGKIYRFVIMDAKYYNIQLEPEKKLSNHPGVESITKQYLYQLAYKDFLEDHGIKEFRNCFLMPHEGTEIINIGFAKMEILSTLGLKDIQVRLLPANSMFDNYLRGSKVDISVLLLS